MEETETFCTRLRLAYVNADTPGIRRVRRGRGFSFHAPDDRLLSGEERDRCVALVIPPAWQQVWICVDVDGHLQASGTDAAGRQQYRYHERWTEGRRLANFDRLRAFPGRLAVLRRDLDRLLEDPTDPTRRASAAMVRMVDAGLARIGGDRSVQEHGHFGISTLRRDHVDVDGDHVTLVYTGKSGVDRRVEVEDPLLADVLAQMESASDDLFSLHEGGRITTLRAANANALLAELTAGSMTCKDFRTWGGSAVALNARIEGADAVAAVDAAAEKLGNTRAVARSSYVHPDVLSAPLAEVEAAWAGARSSVRFDRRERALARLLEKRPPLLDAWLDAT